MSCKYYNCTANSYSSYLAPCDFHYVWATKEVSQELHVTKDKEVKQAVHMASNQPKTFYADTN
jgi:hypothetical protein